MAGPVVVDSYAWVEYAVGSAEGERALRYIEGDDHLYTPAVVVSELSDRATRTDHRTEWTERLAPFIRRNTTVVPLEMALGDRAGRLKWEMREESPQAGLADAMVLATAREYDARVLTGDPDFLVASLADEVIDITEEEPDAVG